MNGNLPFPRGETYFDHDTSRAHSGASMKNVLGLTYKVRQDDSVGQVGDQGELTLMTVQNLTGGSLTHLRGVAPSTGATASPYNIGAAAGSLGAGWLLDDAYSGVTIENKEVFYVVLEGSVKAELGSSAAVVANKGVRFSTGGKLVDLGFDSTSDAIAHCVGVAGSSRSTAASGTHIIFHVGPQYLTGQT